MKVTELYDQATDPLISFEVIPPLRGGSIDRIMSVVEALMAFSPPFIDVTSHAAQASYEEMPDGYVKRRVTRKRPGTIGLCAAIKERFGVETVPHLLCNGFTREETEDALIELHYLGIQSVMALRGDDHGYRKPIPSQRSVNQYAVELVRQISDMNRGKYLDELEEAAPTDFCVGVAGYPEKHFEAPNLKHDIQYLKDKVDAGAGYVVSQMFFDNGPFLQFVSDCRVAGIEVPIVPGIKVFTSRRQLRTLPANFYVNIPEELADEVMQAAPEHAADIGVEWAIKQCEELLSNGIPYLHFYVMQNPEHVRKIVSALV